MGEGITIKCRNCSTKQDFLLGVGWEYSSLETVFDSLRPNQREEVQKILNNHNVIQRDYEWRVFQCIRCMKLFNRLWVMLMYENGQMYETEYACPECGGGLRQAGDLSDIDQVPCGHCGKSALVIDGPFLWD